MNLTTPARIALAFGIFVLTFFISTSVDLAITLSVSAYLLFLRSGYIPIFIASVVIFVTGYVFRYFDVSFRYVSDLAIDAYILFTVGVIIYLKTRKDVLIIINNITRREKSLFSKTVLNRLFISVILAVLFAPITGSYVAAVIGYFIFSYLIKHFNGKIAIGMALVFIVSAGILLLLNNKIYAENLGNYAYFFFVTGTVQEVINLVKHQATQEKEDNMHEDEKEKKKEKEAMEVKDNMGIVVEEGITGKKSDNKILKLLPAVIAFILSFLVFYFYFSLPKVPILQAPALTPTITVEQPTVTPVSILNVSSDSAKLKIIVQNGTEIQGLAASTSAKLKKEGFSHIKIGNASTRDYENWEIVTKIKEPDYTTLFKSILDLSNLIPREATVPADTDILIIIGKNK